MKRPRLRKWAKWTCTLAAGAAVTLAVFSRFCLWGYSTTGNSGDTLWSLGVASGQVLILRMDGLRAERVSPPVGWEMRWSPHWYWGYSGEKGRYGDTEIWHVGVLYAPDPSGWAVGVSVLYPVALTLIPAALLWYADRRRRGPGSCGGCGYDRAGLAVGVKCPECGTVPAPASK
jgi:hypothetical protein